MFVVGASTVEGLRECVERGWFRQAFRLVWLTGRRLASARLLWFLLNLLRVVVLLLLLNTQMSLVPPAWQGQADGGTKLVNALQHGGRMGATVSGVKVAYVFRPETNGIR